MRNRTATICCALACLALGGEAVAQTGATFVVNTTGNESDAVAGDGMCSTGSGVCTLRAAIQEANVAPDLDTIAFAIGSGPQRISVPSSLPAITGPVVIDGSTQPGFSGAPLVELRGSLLVGDGLRILGGGSTVRSLVINGFGSDGVLLEVGGNNVLEGNYIGLDPTGTFAVRNVGAGVRVRSAGNRIGGSQASQRNIISGNGGFGIEGGILIQGAEATGNIVQGNFIGLDAAGLNPVGNLGRGVAIHYASNNLVGGSEPGMGNLVAGNRATGVRVMAQSTGNVIQGNWIGVNKLGQTRWGQWPAPGVLSNARGVHLRGDGNYVLENVIANSTWDGVLFYDGTGKDLFPEGYPSNNIVYGNLIFGNGMNGVGMYVGTRNRIFRNAIFGNVILGINLANSEFEHITPNDPGDADEGTNDLQNHPTLTSAVVNGAQTTVSGVLESEPNASYTLDLYANPACSTSGHGEGRYPVGQVTVTTDGSGSAPFSSVLAVAIPAGWALAATAANANGSTSEFSACVVVQ